jgi:epsilon-lactone hydrolase
MPSKQSEAVRRHWTAARLAMVQPDAERPDDESWGNLTAEPREVDYIETDIETDAGGAPAMWAAPKRSAQDRVLLCTVEGSSAARSIRTARRGGPMGRSRADRRCGSGCTASPPTPA